MKAPHSCLARFVLSSITRPALACSAHAIKVRGAKVAAVYGAVRLQHEALQAPARPVLRNASIGENVIDYARTMEHGHAELFGGATGHVKKMVD